MSGPYSLRIPLAISTSLVSRPCGWRSSASGPAGSHHPCRGSYAECLLPPCFRVGLPPRGLLRGFLALAFDLPLRRGLVFLGGSSPTSFRVVSWMRGSGSLLGLFLMYLRQFLFQILLHLLQHPVRCLRDPRVLRETGCRSGQRQELLRLIHVERHSLHFHFLCYHSPLLLKVN